MSDTTTKSSTIFPIEYLGDAVYASFDGFNVWLHVGSHNNAPVVALEPDVIRALNEYHQRILKEHGHG